MVVKVINDSNNPLPSYKTRGASGMDVYSKNNLTIPSRGRALVQTGLYMEIPEGFEIQVRPRSGLALKSGITVLNTPGTIDSDYRGELGVILVNLSSESFEIKEGDRIAQIVLSRVESITWDMVLLLNESERGDNGFGSTGI
jgi:dUTP pyrophosphatase